MRVFKKIIEVLLEGLILVFPEKYSSKKFNYL